MNHLQFYLITLIELFKILPKRFFVDFKLMPEPTKVKSQNFQHLFLVIGEDFSRKFDLFGVEASHNPL